jgi:hypothetical protein
MLSGSVLLALLATVGIGSPAHAATGEEAGVPMTFTVPGTSVLPVTFTAGDCRQVGHNQAPGLTPSSLSVQKSSQIQNLYSITWNATLYTIHTWDQDKWHATFIFRDAAGNSIFSLKMDGPGMAQGYMYPYSASVNVSVAESQANTITKVDWLGDC